MKNLTRKTFIRGCSVALVSMMIAGVALIDNGTGASVISAAAGTSSLIDVSDKYSTAALRSEYLGANAVSLNPSVKNEERWVIVDLGGSTLIDAYEEATYAATFSDYVNTTAAQNLKAQIERGQNAFLKRLSASGISYEWKYSYATLNNGVAIKVKNSDIAAVKAMGEVKEVYSSEAYAAPQVAEVSNNANVYSTGIYDTSKVKEQGEGMVVAVLDTGLDHTHPAFKNMPKNEEKLGLTKDDVATAVKGLQAYLRNTSSTVNDFYINNKVPFAYDYADDDTEVYPAYSTHGTHVAGIIAGKDETKVVNKDTGETFIGVAPEAQLVIAKVFTDDLDNRSVGSANAVDILAALADCVTLGVDVINMSLGTSAGFSEEGYAQPDVLAKVYERIEENGISLVTAASNDYSSGFGGAYGTNLTSNPDSGTVGSPSTYENALSVASINGQQANYFSINGDSENVAYITEAANANGKAYDFVEMLYKSQNADKSKELTLKYVVVGGVGNAANYTPAIKRELAGGDCIAVVKRGDISFAEKVNIAIGNGAAAVIIYNNVSGSIRMSLGEVNEPIPTCSISMDSGKLLVDSADRSGRGTVTFSYSQAAGPFMSDFSSWGPTPDLKLKPEITAHGGEITSAVPGGYEVLSGTSMATPNMAGAIALLRQYAKTEWVGLEGKELNDFVYQLLMSTATMARNEEGNPYSPRKQGAGLAGINEAMGTKAYLTVDGKDKPKIELGDDPDKTGVYEFSFTVNSFSKAALSYKPEVYVMTESLSTDGKTVAEKAYMLKNCKIEITADGEPVTDTVTVSAGSKVKIGVTITLDDAARKYLDETFENGMYVEGFVRLVSKDEGSGVDLGIPYLGFYGDWTSAPMFDYSIYEVEASKADKSVDEEDKLKASSAASAPYGLYDDEQYIFTMGAYAYTMEDTATAIVPSDEYAALSAYDYEGRRTIYQLYGVAAGLLRSAKKMEIKITDAATGEIVYSVTEDNVRKAFSSGGSNHASYITIRLDPFSWDMSNNKTYLASCEGVLDYKLEEGRESKPQNSFSFKFTVDTEAPRILDQRLRYEAYTENDVTKYRIYLDVDVYDNQYAMSLLPCYRRESDGELALLTHYPLPIYSSKGGVTTVSYEVTDCFDEYIKKGNFFLAVQDYALNESVYQLNYVDATEYPSAIKLKTDNKLTVAAEDGSYPVYNLTLAQYEAYTIEVAEGLVTNTGATALNFICTGVLESKGNEIFTAASSGTEKVTVQNEAGDTLALINVTVTSDGRSKPIIERVAIAPMLNGTEYLAPISSGSIINLKPNTTRQIVASVEPWYSDPEKTVKFIYESTNEKVLQVSEDGTISTFASGYVYVTVSVEGNSMVRTRFRVTVDDELDITNNVLYHFYGGASYVIPDNKNILSIDKEAFKDYTLLEELVLPISVTSIPEGCFSTCTNLRKITIPAECVVINAKAFEGCKSLEEIVLVESVDKITGENYPGTLTIGKNAFKDCVNLKTISNQKRITSAYDYAFAGCTSLEEIDISGLRTSGSHVFEGCTALTSAPMSGNTQVGAYMFNGCTKLNNITYYANAVPEGAFKGCSSLSAFAFDKSVKTIFGFGAYAFAGTAIESITLPNGSYTVGAHAFEDCTELETVTLSQETKIDFGASVFSGCTSFKAFEVTASDYYRTENGLLLNQDGTVLILAPFAAEGFVLPSGVTEIGAGAFAGTEITSIDLNEVTKIGAYAFANSALKTVDVSKISKIPEGAFEGCKALTSVEFGSESVTEIGAYAFAECSALRQFVAVPNATEIGTYAFYKTPIFSIVGGKIQTIGAHAFDGTNLFTIPVPSRPDMTFATIDLPALETLGDFAFANIGSGFQSIKLGPVKEMGDHVFADSAALSSVEFGQGAEVVGSFAFSPASVTMESILMNGVTDRAANPKLTTVVLPDTVTTIGDFAFLYAANLTSGGMDLKGVKTVGMGAFWYCAKVTELDLSGVESVGDYAFEASGLKKANLASATSIGAYAFAESPLEELKIPVVKSIGESAFMATKLKTVEIPKTLELKYESQWVSYDDFHEPVNHEGRYFNSFGSNAFAYISTLEEFTVEEGNEQYFADEYGVLYGVISGTKENGTYVLLQYPAGNIKNPDRSYTVKAGTVRIGDGAFFSVSRLDEVTFPYTLKEIGSSAFYYCANLEKYIFTSVEAPVLEASYNPMSVASDSSTEAQIAEIAFYYGIYYNNFYNYAAYAIIGGADFGLTLVRPENGIGYDGGVWAEYFKTVESGAYEFEDYTREVKAWLEENLPAMDNVTAELKGLSSDAKLNYVKSLSANTLKEAREKYNKVSSDGQRALISELFEKLAALETLVRDTRSELGDPVALAELKVKQLPVTTYYVGQTYDPSDLILRAIYEDTSEVLLTVEDLTPVSGIPSAAFTLEDDNREIVYSYGGITHTVYITVIERPVDPEKPDPEPEEGGLDTVVIVGIAVGCAVVAAGAVVAAVLVLKKRKKTALKAENIRGAEEETASPEEGTDDTNHESD